MAQYSYVYANNLYLNITNRCMMACPYCIKHKWVGKFRGNSLRLDKEPTVEQVIESIGTITSKAATKCLLPSLFWKEVFIKSAFILA